MAGPWAGDSGEKTGVRAVVAGDRGTGKSSLIATIATDSFPENVQPVLPLTRLPADYYPDRVPITVVDTTSRPEQRSKLIMELQLADVVMLTYACDRPETLERIGSYWIPELRRLEVKAPVIVVGCKLDLREDQNANLEQVVSPIMQQFREIEMCIECSALKQTQVPEVFYYAQKAVLHPTAPLFDQETQLLTSRCVRALKRIFIHCDHDRDGALSDAELNAFQIRCFNAPLQPAEIEGVKKVIQEKVSEGINEQGLTLTGFLFLHALFIEKGRIETTWSVLRKFGYDNDVKLRSGLISINFRRAPDQVVELKSEVIDFLRGIFETFDIDCDGTLLPAELDDLFSTAPESPWTKEPYKDAAEMNTMGGLSLEGFLSEWALMTLLDPTNSLYNLMYIGYSAEISSAFNISRKRRVDRKRQKSERNVFQCLVFGPKNSGKSAILNSFIGRPFSDRYTPTIKECFAANMVDLSEGGKKTLVMQEIPEDNLKQLLSIKDTLAACDIAVFVHDSSDKNSWKKTSKMLLDVATLGENSGYEVPCLIISAKEDLDSYPLSIQNAARASQFMGIETPISISAKSRNLNNLFQRIVHAAQHPHLSIPETAAGKQRKQHRQAVNHSLLFVSVGAALAFVGLAAYRAYMSNRHRSG